LADVPLRISTLAVAARGQTGTRRPGSSMTHDPTRRDRDSAADLHKLTRNLDDRFCFDRIMKFRNALNRRLIGCLPASMTIQTLKLTITGHDPLIGRNRGSN
jgi:hypothetical protein